MVNVKSDGVYVDGVLKMPFDKDVIINDLASNVLNNNFKTINNESILGTGNITTGKILQVKTLTTGPNRYYYRQVDEIEVPGLNTIITPKSDNSTFIITGYVHTTLSYVYSIGVKFRDNFIQTPTSNNRQHSNSIYTKYVGANSTSYVEPIPITTFINNDSLDDAYIGVYVKAVWNNIPYSIYINDRSNGDMRSTSNIIIMEVSND